jgi:hypothetical protein
MTILIFLKWRFDECSPLPAHSIFLSHHRQLLNFFTFSFCDYNNYQITCRLLPQIMYVWIIQFQIRNFPFRYYITPHTHTHLNNLSKLLPFSHFQLGIYWKTNCVCATPNTFFFFLIMWIFIWYSLGFLFIRCGRWLNEVMFVTPLTNPVTLFLISSAKWTSIQFLPFTFIECACLWICLFCNMISSL